MLAATMIERMNEIELLRYIARRLRGVQYAVEMLPFLLLVLVFSVEFGWRRRK